MSYLRHQVYLKHRNGHGIHSPYLFEVVHKVIFNAAREKVPGAVSTLHMELRREGTQLDADGPGARSKLPHSGKRSVRSFTRSSSVSCKYGALLYRFSKWYGPDVILELGTGIGLSATYLASGSPETPLYTIEGNRDRADFSSGLFKRSGLRAVQVRVGEMGEELERLTGGLSGKILVFMDGNHRYDPTITYLRQILKHTGEESLIILDDIYWSRGMQRAWREVIKWPEVRMSIDLFRMGVLLLRKDLNKVDLKIKF